MMSENPNVSIVVCAYNEEVYLHQSLTSLVKLNYPKEQYEIILVDDDSSDKTPEIATEFADQYQDLVTYKRIDHGGLSYARNIGICLSKNEVIAFIDGDAIADRDWLVNLIKPFKDQNVAVVGGIVENLNSDNEFASFLHHVHYLPPKKGKESLSDVIGTCMAYRRSYFEDNGGFYDFFDRRGDETTVNKILNVNYNYAIQHDAIVYHERPTNLRSYLKMTIQNGYYGYFSNFFVEKITDRNPAKIYGFKMLINRILNLLFYPLLLVMLCFQTLEALVIFAPPFLAFTFRQVVRGSIFLQVMKIWGYNGSGLKIVNLVRGICIYLAAHLYSDIGFIKAFIQGVRNVSLNNSINNCGKRQLA